MTPLTAPFPYFGGKSRAAPLIWQALGDVPNYVEPFAGSLATLLARPHAPQIETVNDKDAFIANVWRALQADPEAVIRWCARPPNEADLHAIHCWLLQHRASVTARLMGDPDYYDVRVAGYWLYGMACWIGSGFCHGEGPWQSVDGQLVHTGSGPVQALGNAGRGIHRKLVHLGNAGQGIHRKRVHLGNAGRGIHRQLVHLGSAGQEDGLVAWFTALQQRLRHVRVCCGDWTRVLGPSPTVQLGLTGVLLDPPYPTAAEREMGLYREDDDAVAHTVEQWCRTHGGDPRLRLVLCGYGSTHDALLAHGWTRVTWQAAGGYGAQGHGRGRANAAKEVLWCSPHCQPVTQQLALF